MTSLIMDRPLPRKRGRPRKQVIHNDYGTPELMAKKMRGETAEAIDLCLERRLITDAQHWSGMHLRWLYTLRYGVPTIRAMDPAYTSGMISKPTDAEWYAQREKEFSEAIELLASQGYAKLVTSICIYNESPPFLTTHDIQKPRLTAQVYNLIYAFRNGLELLVTHWKK